MVVEVGDAAAAAANTALKMGSNVADAIVFMAELGEKLPVLAPVLGTIKVIREKWVTVNRNGQELAALEQRCTYIAACIIEKHNATPNLEVDVTPLKTCVEAVKAYVDVCGRSNRQGRLRRFVKASDDKDEIAGLNARVDRLTGDLGLAGIAIMENKIDNLKATLEAMDKRHAAKQEQMLANQDSFKRHQTEFGERLPKMPGRLAKVPKAAPASKDWYFERHLVVIDALGALTKCGGPRLVGLVGAKGSGKTTAASDIVRSPEVREAFHDGIVWMSINKGANKRLPSLMVQLARMVYEDIWGSVGSAPAPSDDGAAYIKRRIEQGNVGRGLKCLVVADDVWEKEVVSKLVATGMWVLLSTRDEELVKGAEGDVVGVHEMSMTDAKSVLRSAAEIPSHVDLPDNAVDIIDLCGRVVMDLAFVGRWSIVHKRQQREAWSDAANNIRIEMAKVQTKSESDVMEFNHARRQNAILRAGFEDLARGSDDMRVPWLYLSLAVMPDGHAFTVKDAAVLLCNSTPSADDVLSASLVIEMLERWTVVRLTEGTYHMHDAHSSFARERLLDRGDVRRPALARWVGFISSLKALRSINAFVLKELWLAVARVGGDGWAESRPYAAALDAMGESDPFLRQSIASMGKFQQEQGDWEAASNTWRRFLKVERRESGHDHSFLLSTLERLADCADRLGHVTEASEWRSKRSRALPLALARRQLQLDVASVGSGEEAVATGRRNDGSCGLYNVDNHISSSGNTKPLTPLTQDTETGPELPQPFPNHARQPLYTGGDFQGNYSDQNQRAILWAGFYLTGWILQRLWCYLGLPEHCHLAMKPLEVLTDLVVLLGFALAQAWWCEILEESRFEELVKSPWVVAVTLTTPILVSALGLIKSPEACDISHSREHFEFSEILSALFMFGLISTLFMTSWHFSRAWETLPGTVLISGGGVEPQRPMVNFHGVYASGWLMVVGWSVIVFSLILKEDDGLNYRGGLLAWVLSLIAVFPHPVSYVWLAVTTGVFLQGIGAHRLRFLGCTEMH